MIRPPESFDGLDDFAVIFSEKEKWDNEQQNKIPSNTNSPRCHQLLSNLIRQNKKKTPQVYLIILKNSIIGQLTSTMSDFSK